MCMQMCSVAADTLGERQCWRPTDDVSTLAFSANALVKSWSMRLLASDQPLPEAAGHTSPASSCHQKGNSPSPQPVTQNDCHQTGIKCRVDGSKGLCFGHSSGSEWTSHAPSLASEEEPAGYVTEVSEWWLLSS